MVVAAAQVVVAAPQPTTDTLALAATTAQSSGCKLTGDVQMISQSRGVSKFEAPCRGNKKPMKIICQNDDCKRDWIHAFPQNAAQRSFKAGAHHPTAASASRCLGPGRGDARENAGDDFGGDRPP